MGSNESRHIPLVDLKAQYEHLKSEIDAAITDVVLSSEFILGSKVTELESRFAALTGAVDAVGVSSATAGLHLALFALGIRSGDEVVLPSHTFVATAEAVCQCGAIPVFVDIEETSYTMNPECFDRAVTPRTRAVIPVHLYGRCAKMKCINDIASARHISIVEDAAQAHGACCSYGKAGSMADAAVFSFYPGKNLGAFGDGGIITVSDGELGNMMRKLANHGRSKKYIHEMSGFNYRLDALQAAIVSVKLKYLETWNKKRRLLAKTYNDAFKNLPCYTPEIHEGHVFHVYVIRVSERDQLIKTLRNNNIHAGIHYPIPCHLQPCFKQYNTMSLPITETIVDEIASLPLYPEMSGKQQERIIRLVETHCKRYPLEVAC